MQEHSLKIDYSARYFIKNHASAENIWMFLHGYAQKACDFAESFDEASLSEICSIFPEALSHFYVRGAHGKVGASWMTSERRDLDIANSMTYLSQICAHLNKQPNVILGFSQGAETACRFAVLQEIPKLVVWAGRLAPDSLEGAALDKLRSKRIVVVFGESDSLISQDRFKDDLDHYASLGLTVEVVSFSGGHKIDLNAFAKVVDLIN